MRCNRCSSAFVRRECHDGTSDVHFTRNSQRRARLKARTRIPREMSLGVTVLRRACNVHITPQYIRLTMYVFAWRELSQVPVMRYLIPNSCRKVMLSEPMHMFVLRTRFIPCKIPCKLVGLNTESALLLMD